MKRGLVQLLTVLSLILCVSVAALWGRSYWINDSLEWQTHYHQRYVVCNRGRVLIQINHGPGAGEEYEPIVYNAYVLHPRDRSGLGRPWQFGGFWIENDSFPPNERHAKSVPYTDIVVPL